ncbi:MAG TPA: sodium:calcium antiporter [Alphaproteobacteria bacterium]|nr:sodium:calcium antiporter [Alphaproteobacteria bacterium]HAJ47166.1 sodium:calcium antiporter [Alphaproteobacteria bacterium]
MDSVWVLIGLGLLFLAFGGNFLVRASVDIAARLGVSPLLIGLTLVGFGTSTPELVTSIQAALVHAPGIAIGNIVGSNISNILLIIGLSALLTPIAARAGAVFRDGAFVVITAVLLAWVSLTDGLSAGTGVLFLALLVIYVLIAWASERAQSTTVQVAIAHSRSGLALSLVIAAASIAILILGASFLVEGSVRLARSNGFSEEFVGLTIVAIGTSLPELFTSVTAAFKRQSDIALGNVLGSSIYNILGIGGATALIHPVAVPAQIANFDNLIMIGASVLILLWCLLARGIGRLGGLVFLALYGGYIYVIHPSQAVLLQDLTKALAPLVQALARVT